MSSNLFRSVLLFIAIFLLFTSCSPEEPREKTSPITNASGKLQIHILDVGQGDSILIVTPQRKVVLIDAGLARAGEDVLEDLKRYDITGIDLAVATHPHADHIGGMAKVLNGVPVKMFLDSGQAHPTATYEKMLATVKERIGSLEVARAGQEFELDSGVKIDVLGPSDPLIDKVSGSVENANSVVLRLSFGNFRMLFTGDSEDETEERLIETGADLRAQVLKVAHHGSRYASTEEFLERVKPQVALISCGKDNDYGHPAPETLDRLKSLGVKLHRTDLEGTITIVSDGKDFQVSADHEPIGSVWEGRVTDSGAGKKKKKSKK